VFQVLQLKREKTRGQALMLICLSSTVLFALLGLVVDVGWMYWRKEACLSAAQAGALAGVAKVSSQTSITCSTTGVFCNTTPQQCPANGATDNSGVACDYANANFFNPATNSNQNVTISASTGTPPTASGASASYYMTVRVTEKRYLTFLSVLGVTLGYVSARATAGIFTTAAGSCVYILDPSGQASLNASNDAQITASCGIWDYSSATNGLYAVGSANVTTTSGQIQYNGGYYTDNSGSRFSPTPTQEAAGTNPLSGLVVPWSNCLNPSTGATLGTCTTTTCQYTGCTGTSTHCDYTQGTWSSWQATPYQFSPGVYCGGITVSNGMGAYFSPGMYVINGGGVTLNGSSTYCVGTGTCSTANGGVVFYLTGTDANYQGFVVGNGSTANLSAPTTGDLEGLLVYSDPAITAPTTALSSCNSYVPPSYGSLPTGSSSFCGGASSSLTGIIYLPNTTVAFTNGTGTGGALSLVVKDAVFNGGSSFFSSVTGGVLASSGAGSVKTALIE
jgi:hypothetical protein